MYRAKGALIFEKHGENYADLRIRLTRLLVRQCINLRFTGESTDSFTRSIHTCKMNKLFILQPTRRKCVLFVAYACKFIYFVVTHRMQVENHALVDTVFIRDANVFRILRDHQLYRFEIRFAMGKI